jgi:hypothetical protein
VAMEHPNAAVEQPDLEAAVEHSDPEAARRAPGRSRCISEPAAGS